MDMWRFNPADYEPGKPLYVADFGWSDQVTRYEVKRVTPGGQVVAQSAGGVEIRVNKFGTIVGAGQWSRRRVVSAKRAAEIAEQILENNRWNVLRKLGEEVSAAARKHDPEALHKTIAALAALAQEVPDDR